MKERYWQSVHMAVVCRQFEVFTRLPYSLMSVQRNSWIYQKVMASTSSSIVCSVVPLLALVIKCRIQVQVSFCRRMSIYAKQKQFLWRSPGGRSVRNKWFSEFFTIYPYFLEQSDAYCLTFSSIFCKFAVKCLWYCFDSHPVWNFSCRKAEEYVPS